jgi:hypothetical protein
MLKKLFTAGLLLLVTATANATLMGINGTFSVGSLAAESTLSDDNLLTSIIFHNAKAGAAEGDFASFLPSGFSEGVPLVSLTSPLIIGVDAITGKFITDFSFLVGGFTFVSEEVMSNTWSSTSASQTTNLSADLHLRGTMSGNGFADTYTQLIFSTQGLTSGDTKTRSWSLTVTSPAPVLVPEPGTLAIFALGLVGFAASSRKKKSV